MALGDGYGLPTGSMSIQKAIDISNGLNNNVPMLQNPTTASNTAAQSALSSVELPEVPPGHPLEGQLGQLNDTLLDLNGAFTDFGAHTDAAVTKIPQVSGQIENDLNLFQSNNPSETNICDQVQNFFGSILGAGAALLGTALGLINQLLSAIGQGLAALQAIIGSIIAQINQIVTDLLTMIANEIAALASLLSRAINYALGSLLSSIGSNSCLNLLVAAAGTTALTTILNN